MSTPPPGDKQAERPRIHRVHISDPEALHGAFMPFVKGGGLFLENLDGFKLGDSINVLFKMMDEPEVLLMSTVIWVTPPGSLIHRKGIGIQIPEKHKHLAPKIHMNITRQSDQGLRALTM